MAAKNERGFTLIELMVVLVIMTTLAALTTPNIVNELQLRRASLAIEETQLIVDAARSFRMRYGSWPGGATCSSALSVLRNTSPAMLVGVPDVNRFNSAYSTSCTSATFSVDQNAVVDWDGFIANSLAGTTIADGATSQLRTTVGIPGSEPALDSKLSRIATGNAELNRMRTNLLLGGNDITEAKLISAVDGQLSGGLTVNQATTLRGVLLAQGTSQFQGEAIFNEAVILNKIVSEGASCSKAGALARNNAGATLHCEGGKWTKGGGGAESVLSSCTCTDCGFNTGKSCTPSCPSGYNLTSKVDTGDWSVTHNRHRIWVGICSL